MPPAPPRPFFWLISFCLSPRKGEAGMVNLQAGYLKVGQLRVQAVTLSTTHIGLAPWLRLTASRGWDSILHQLRRRVGSNGRLRVCPTGASRSWSRRVVWMDIIASRPVNWFPLIFLAQVKVILSPGVGVGVDQITTTPTPGFIILQVQSYLFGEKLKFRVLIITIFEPRTATTCVTQMTASRVSNYTFTFRSSPKNKNK